STLDHAEVEEEDEEYALSREMEKLKREAEMALAKERAENAVMRERISDVAAEIARITRVLEGPSSPIDAILAGDPTRVNGGVNGHGTGGAPNGESANASLADRIRALQSRAPRAAPRPAARA